MTSRFQGLSEKQKFPGGFTPFSPPDPDEHLNLSNPSKGMEQLQDMRQSIAHS